MTTNLRWHAEQARAMLHMSEDELIALLREHGFSDHYIEIELAALRQYREVIVSEPVVTSATDTEYTRASRRRRGEE